MRLIKIIKERFWVILIGTGLALSPIHNSWLTNLATNAQGETLFFLPAFGYLLLIMGTGMFLIHNWEKVKAEGLGDKRIWIPLLVIVGAIGLSGIAIDGSVQDKIAPLGMGVTLFALYLTARILGKDVFLPLAVGAAIASIGITAHQFWSPGTSTGGFVFDANYDIATGYILLGAALFFRQHQWLLALLGTSALLLSGSLEFAFCLAVIGVVILVREHWSRRLAIATGTLMIVGVTFFASGYGIPTWHRAEQAIDDATNGGVWGSNSSGPLSGRWVVITKAMDNIKPLGDGYSLTGFNTKTVHNVPLIIIQQLGWPGILAALAWLWVSLRCLIKTRFKYVWTLILAMCVFDHFLWTQFAPLFWAVVGMSTVANNVESSLFAPERLEKCPILPVV